MQGITFVHVIAQTYTSSAPTPRKMYNTETPLHKPHTSTMPHDINTSPPPITTPLQNTETPPLSDQIPASPSPV